jgi:hypothetical protein
LQFAFAVLQRGSAMFEWSITAVEASVVVLERDRAALRRRSAGS